MVENFLKQYAMLIADHPNSVRTEVNKGDEYTEIIIYADKADLSSQMLLFFAGNFRLDR